MAAGHLVSPPEARASSKTLAPRPQAVPAQQQNGHSAKAGRQGCFRFHLAVGLLEAEVLQRAQEVLELGTKVLCEASFDNGKREQRDLFLWEPQRQQNNF